MTRDPRNNQRGTGERTGHRHVGLAGQAGRAGPAGRGWSRFGFAVGVAASVAANVAHSWIRPTTTGPAATGTAGTGRAGSVPAGWSPPAGAILAAGFWPLALVISVEVISRVRWPRRWYWALIRFGGLAAVATIAAIISYRHLSGLLHAYGEDPLSATIGPLAVDGLMVICSAALLAIGANQRHNRQATGPVTATPVTRATETVASETVPPETLPPLPVAHRPDAAAATGPAVTEPSVTGPGVTGPAGTGVPPATHRTSTPGPDTRRSGTRGRSRTGTRTDGQLLAQLTRLPRNPDGTVPVRRAAAALSIGPDRARRLLDTAGLLRTGMSPAVAPPPDSSSPRGGDA